MYSYIMRRLAFGMVTVVGVSIIVFMVLRILPGDPLVAIFGPEGFTKLSEAERARYMADLGLSDPLVVQYLHWMGDILRGNLADRGRAVLGRRHPGGDPQRAEAQQPRRQCLAVLQHPVSRDPRLLVR